jgi:hypothetical protein
MCFSNLWGLIVIRFSSMDNKHSLSKTVSYLLYPAWEKPYMNVYERISAWYKVFFEKLTFIQLVKKLLAL